MQNHITKFYPAAAGALIGVEDLRRDLITASNQHPLEDDGLALLAEADDALRQAETALQKLAGHAFAETRKSWPDHNAKTVVALPPISDGPQS